MTSVQRASRVSGVAALLIEFLESGDFEDHQRDLLREFCREKEVSALDAEIALSMLLNKGEVVANREMHLERRAVAAA